MAITGKSKGDVVQELENVYQVARSTVFNRLKFLGYSLDKVDGLFSLSDEQCAELDKLHQWINDGGKLADYPKPSQLVTVSESEIDPYTINLEDLEGDEELGYAELIRAAQNQAAGILIAENLLTAQMLKHPELLPEDLRKQVEQSKVAISPKPRSPLMIAGEWLTMAKTYQQQQVQTSATKTKTYQQQQREPSLRQAQEPSAVSV